MLIQYDPTYDLTERRKSWALAPADIHEMKRRIATEPTRSLRLLSKRWLKSLKPMASHTHPNM